MFEKLKSGATTVIGTAVVLGFFALPFVFNSNDASDTDNSSNTSSTSQAVPSSEAASKSSSASDSDLVNTGVDETAPSVDTSIESDESCDPNYDPCVPNVSYDLDCADIGFEVRVIGTDTNHFDRDNDGYGCESY